MNVLMLSTDQKIFDVGSEVHQRMIGYGDLIEELHIVVYTKRKVTSEKRFALAKNTFAYPTNSMFRALYFYDAFFTARQILNANLRERAWVVTSQDPFETSFVGYLLKRIYHLPLQIQIHTDFLSPSFWSESLKNKIRVIFGKFLIMRADNIRVVSERIKNSIIEQRSALANLIVVLPVFVEIEKIRATTITTDLHTKYPQFDFIILMASRLTREKNISMAIDAMRSVVKKHPKVGLIIVGSGPEQNTLQGMTIRYKLQNNVILEPWTDDPVSYYKTADCYVLTSNYEGYGRTMVEAMAAGCPVIMTDVGIAGDIVKESVNGRIVQPNRPDELADVVSSLYADAALRKKYIVSGYTTVSALWSKNKFFELWKKALENTNTFYRRKKLCYILPEYIKEDATHFSHVHDFIEEITKSINVSLIIERDTMPSDNLGTESARLARSHVLLLVWYILRARVAGYRDFYIHYSFRAAFAASIIVRWNGGRVLYWNCGEPWKFQRSFVREQFERFVYRVITFLVTGTATMKEAYAREYNIPLKKIKILPNWINTKRFATSIATSTALRGKLGIGKDTKVTLFVHHLSKRKGADLIVPTFQVLQQQNLNVIILVIGSGPEEEVLQKTILKEKLQNTIQLLGPIPNTEIQNYFGIADVFFMPSREEGFPRVLLESMVMGVPFVACDVGGVRDIIPAAAEPYVIASEDIPKLAYTLQKVLTLTPDERIRLTTTLKEWVSRYDIEKVSKHFFEVIYNNI